MGDKCFVHDGFEFEELKTRVDLWEMLKVQKEFASLAGFVDLVDGVVEVKVVPESALLAVEGE